MEGFPLLRCCFNWRVWVGVAIVSVGVLALAPRAALAVVPVALGLACPLSMLVMMRGMWSSTASPSADSAQATKARFAALETELAELRSMEPSPTDDGRDETRVSMPPGREATPEA